LLGGDSVVMDQQFGAQQGGGGGVGSSSRSDADNEQQQHKSSKSPQAKSKSPQAKSKSKSLSGVRAANVQHLREKTGALLNEVSTGGGGYWWLPANK
jgi:hypothetical protein